MNSDQLIALMALLADLQADRTSLKAQVVDLQTQLAAALSDKTEG